MTLIYDSYFISWNFIAQTFAIQEDLTSYLVFIYRIRTARMRDPYSNMPAGFFEKVKRKEFSKNIFSTLATWKVDYMEEECSDCHKKKVRNIIAKLIYIFFTEIKLFSVVFWMLNDFFWLIVKGIFWWCKTILIA